MKDVKSASYNFRDSGKGGKKKLRGMSIDLADNGGATVRHNYHEGGTDAKPVYHRPDEFVFGPTEGPQLHAHLAKHLKQLGEEKGEKEDKKESPKEEAAEEAGE